MNKVPPETCRYCPADAERECLFPDRAWVVDLAIRSDPRGKLLPLDFSGLPFAPARAFVVHEIPAGCVRGGHAHRRGCQILIRLSGRIGVQLRFGGETRELVLNSTDRALMIGPGVWAQQTYLDAGSTLLVLASDPYDATSYVVDLS